MDLAISIVFLLILVALIVSMWMEKREKDKIGKWDEL